MYFGVKGYFFNDVLWKLKLENEKLFDLKSMNILSPFFFRADRLFNAGAPMAEELEHEMKLFGHTIIGVGVKFTLESLSAFIFYLKRF